MLLLCIGNQDSLRVIVTLTLLKHIRGLEFKYDVIYSYDDGVGNDLQSIGYVICVRSYRP